MSYLTQAQDPRRRAAALTATVAVHAALAVAIVTGLTITGAVPLDDILTAVPITPDPTPPPPEPQKAQEPQKQDSVITVPPSPLDLHHDDPPVQAELTDTVISDVSVLPQRDPVVIPDPPVRSIFTPRKAAPSNDTRRWVTTDDYPGSELRNEVEGVASYRVIVGTNGRVSSCEIVRGSGSSRLDSATCRNITQRARFDPATDETGAKVVGTFSGSVHWQIPD